MVGDRVVSSHRSPLGSDEVVIVLHDVTDRVEALEEQRTAEKRIAHMAMHDTLTGLPNRAAFEVRLQETMQSAEDDGTKFFLLNVDLDRFKEVNDVFGHKVGDGLLAEVTERLSAWLRDDEFIARVGGDEFIALPPQRDEQPDTPELASRFIEALKSSFEIEGKLVRSGLSVGASLFPDHGDTPELLLSNADAAMYRAKRSKLDQLCLFDTAMDRNIRERTVLTRDLKETVLNNEVEIFFQPMASVAQGLLTGFEALARWEHPRFGQVPPSTFIPLAEENGLIIDLGLCVLNKSCLIAASWPRDYRVSVNISPVQIRHTDLVRVVERALDMSGIDPSRLELEITEAALQDAPDYAGHVLRGLKELGVSLSMDDFGTGQSSLFSMTSFPFDKVKLDRSFVQNIASNTPTNEIVRAVLGLSSSLGLQAIAEGVEDPASIEALHQYGCTEMQGYLVGSPASDIKTTELIMRGQRLAHLPLPGERNGLFSKSIRSLQR